MPLRALADPTAGVLGQVLGSHKEQDLILAFHPDRAINKSAPRGQRLRALAGVPGMLGGSGGGWTVPLYWCEAP